MNKNYWILKKTTKAHLFCSFFFGGGGDWYCQCLPKPAVRHLSHQQNHPSLRKHHENNLIQFGNVGSNIIPHMAFPFFSSWHRLQWSKLWRLLLFSWAGANKTYLCSQLVKVMLTVFFPWNWTITLEIRKSRSNIKIRKKTLGSPEGFALKPSNHYFPHPYHTHNFSSFFFFFLDVIPNPV